MKPFAHQTKWLYGSVIALLLLVLLGYRTVGHHHATAAHAGAQLTGTERCQLKSGDLILRRGEGLVSDQISYVLRKQPYDVTHCGIIYQQGDSFFVVHSIADNEHQIDGVIAQNLNQFLADSRPNSIIVLRYNDMDSHRTELMQRTDYYLQKSPPFDFAFDIADSSRFYCAELIWHVFKDVCHKDVFTDKMNVAGNQLLEYSSFFHGHDFSAIINQQAALANR